MKASLSVPPKPSPAANSRTLNSLGLFVAIDVLFYFWTLNFNKLGNFYDYSILADAAGKLGAGLRPFRDFSSTLQSLPIWLARACELIFGARYLALAYGNLVLTLILFFVVLSYAKKVFPYFLALLISMAVCVASSLQHGIIWYNSIALLLLCAIALKCADLLRLRKIRTRDAIQVGALLLLMGLTKLNFDAVAVGTSAFFALAGFVISLRSPGEHQTLKEIMLIGAIGAACCIAPPFIEVSANGTNLSTWAREVVFTPASRAGGLAYVSSSAFYLKEWNPFYPGTLLGGSVLFCLLVYGFIAYTVAAKFLENKKIEKRTDFQGLIIRLSIICLFWASTSVLILTNVEIESLCLCYCLVGMVAMRISGLFPVDKYEKVLQTCSIVLAIYFLVIGGVSMARHSRISYRGNNFTNASQPTPTGPGYLRGVVLSNQAAVRLAMVEEVLKNDNGIPVYWGPGLELMNRIQAGVVSPRFPLWYHLQVTVRDVDAQPIIDAIERSEAGLVVVDPDWTGELPDNVLPYLNNSWDIQEQSTPLLVYKRKTR
jgi:hypothetical protein